MWSCQDSEPENHISGYPSNFQPYFLIFNHNRKKYPHALGQNDKLSLYLPLNSILACLTCKEKCCGFIRGALCQLLSHINVWSLYSKSLTVFQWGERIWENRGHQTSPSLPSGNRSQMQSFATGTHTYTHTHSSWPKQNAARTHIFLSIKMTNVCASSLSVFLWLWLLLAEDWGSGVPCMTCALHFTPHLHIWP